MPDVPAAAEDAANNATVTAGTTYYLSLHTGDPGQTGANESSEGRESIVFATSSGGTMPSTTSQNWPSAVGGSYPWFGVWTAASGGTFVRGGHMGSPLVVMAGQSITFASGAVTFVAG